MKKLNLWVASSISKSSKSWRFSLWFESIQKTRSRRPCSLWPNEKLKVLSSSFFFWSQSRNFTASLFPWPRGATFYKLVNKKKIKKSRNQEIKKSKNQKIKKSRKNYIENCANFSNWNIYLFSQQYPSNLSRSEFCRIIFKDFAFNFFWNNICLDLSMIMSRIEIGDQPLISAFVEA